MPRTLVRFYQALASLHDLTLVDAVPIAAAMGRGLNWAVLTDSGPLSSSCRKVVRHLRTTGSRSPGTAAPTRRGERSGVAHDGNVAETLCHHARLTRADMIVRGSLCACASAREGSRRHDAVAAQDLPCPTVSVLLRMKGRRSPEASARHPPASNGPQASSRSPGIAVKRCPRHSAGLLIQGKQAKPRCLDRIRHRR
jgi:hypothetical protein